jgi:hypothetical protein
MKAIIKRRATINLLVCMAGNFRNVKIATLCKKYTTDLRTLKDTIMQSGGVTKLRTANHLSTINQLYYKVKNEQFKTQGFPGSH